MPRSYNDPEMPIAKVLDDYSGARREIPRCDEDMEKLRRGERLGHGGRRHHAGRPISTQPRCECGAFTLHSATLRRHRCADHDLQRSIMRKLGELAAAWRHQASHNHAFVDKKAELPAGMMQALENRESPLDASLITVAQLQRIAAAINCDLDIRLVERPSAMDRALEQLGIRKPKRLDELFAQFPETE